MKVIFIEDVPNVARVGQTRDVANGFARNYLLPKKLAVVADSRDALAMQSQIEKKIKQRELEEAEMAKFAEKITGAEITIKAKVGESEKLYGSVTAADISEELAKSAGHDVDKKLIVIAEPIRQLGPHDVTVRFTHEITATITVNVIPDEESEEKAEKVEKKTEKKPKAKAKTKKTKAKKEESEAPETEAEKATVDSVPDLIEAESSDVTDMTDAIDEEAKKYIEHAGEKASEVIIKEPEPVSEEVEAIEEELDAKE